MGISYAEGQKGKRPAASWFRFDPARFALAPGETRTVRTLISPPAGADPGDYEGMLAAQIATEGKGARVGAAAAARVTFTIEPSSVLQAYWLKARRSAADNAPWSWAVPLALTLLAAGWCS